MNDQVDRRRILRRGHTSAAILCAVAIGLFFVATVRDGHEWGDDFSLYIRHAQNLVRGEPYEETGYIYNPQNAALGPRAYPPGFPLLLAPIVGTFGPELRPMKILVVMFLVGSLLVMIPLFRRILPPRDVVLLVVIVGLNPFFWEFKDHVLSDLPFLFFVLVSLLCFTRAEAHDHSARRRTTLLLLAGVAAYAACATRTLGLVLLPCYAASDLLRHRRITAHASITGAVVVTFIGIQQVFGFQDRSYIDQLSNPLTAARQNIPDYVRSLTVLWDNGYSENARRIAFVAAGVLAAVGYVRSWRADALAVHVFPAMYLAPVLLWPSYQGIRFLIPVVPFYFCYCLIGVRGLMAVGENRRSVPGNAVLGVFLGAVFITYAARYSVLPFGPLPSGIAKQESAELFAYVAAATDPAEVLIFSKPRALALMTGRRVSGPFRPDDPCQLWQYIREIRASYIVTGPGKDPFNEDALYLQQFVARFEADLRRVMANADVAVYRIEQNPCYRPS